MRTKTLFAVAVTVTLLLLGVPVVGQVADILLERWTLTDSVGVTLCQEHPPRTSTPEGALTGAPCDTVRQTNGAVDNVFWSKAGGSGTDMTGWFALSSTEGPHPIVLASDVTGTLGETNGGTGQATYVEGDLLYSDTANSLARLAAVAAGSPLMSTGVGTAPVWDNTPSFTGVVTFVLAGDTVVTGAYTRQLTIEAGATQQGATAPTPVTTGTTRGLAFDADAEEAFFSFKVPSDWDGASDILIDVDWSPESGTAMADTETVIWTVDYRSVATGETITNGTLVTTTVTYTQSGAGTDNELIESVLTIDFDDVNQPLAVADHIFFDFSRDFTGDTYTSDAVVQEWDMEYQSIGLPTGG